MKKQKRLLLILPILLIVVTLLGLALGNDWSILIGSCGLLGFLVKSTDQLIDLEASKQKKEIFLMAGAIPIIMGYLAFRYDPVFGMVVGTGLGLLFSGKFDHPGYYLSFFGFLAVIFIIAFAFDMEFSREPFYLIPMALVGSFLDEHIHEKTATKQDAVHTFFDHRPLLKITALVATIIGFAELVHLVGFLFFDLLYDTVGFFWKE